MQSSPRQASINLFPGCASLKPEETRLVRALETEARRRWRLAFNLRQKRANPIFPTEHKKLQKINSHEKVAAAGFR